MALPTKLQVDRSLINPKFDGYKLAPLSASSSSQPSTHSTSSSAMGGGATVSGIALPPSSLRPLLVQPNASRHFALNYLSQFVAHNHLVADPFDAGQDGELAYYIDQQWQVVRVLAPHAVEQDQPCAVVEHVAASIQAPVSAAPAHDPFNPTISFPSAHLAVIADGLDRLLLFDRTSKPWRQLVSTSVVVRGVDGKTSPLAPLVVRSTVMDAKQSSTVVCLVQTTEERPATKPGADTCLVGLHVVRVSVPPVDSAPAVNPSATVAFSLMTPASPFYAHLDPEQGSLVVVTDRTLTSTHHPAATAAATQASSASDPKANTTHASAATPATPSAPFTWSQHVSEVSIQIPVHRSVTSKQVSCKFESEHLKVTVRGAATTEVVPVDFGGALFDEVDPDECTWSIQRPANGGQPFLEVILVKVAETRMTWTRLFTDGPFNHVEATLSDAQKVAIAASLAKYTTDESEQDIRAASKRGLGWSATPTSQPTAAPASASAPSQSKIEELIDDEDDGQPIVGSDAAAAAASHPQQPTDIPEDYAAGAFAHTVEECDFDDVDSSNLALSVFDSHGHCTSTLALDSAQFLFSTAASRLPSGSVALPAFAVRYNVDGVVFSVHPSQSQRSIAHHSATFNAFGYVQASKREKKFLGGAADGRFAFLCEASRHLFVFEQPGTTGSATSSSSSAKQTLPAFPLAPSQATTARQFLAPIESGATVLGAAVVNRAILALTEDYLSVTRVP
ncbi:hypothetical protein CAOG_02640 [Capsaspora owczarzaki ATCC 30864]|uniref:NudC domain-containing protein 1 n=1 Tax=Capsaspora owczarzaki (strain ATCC 30864) TaxID=595528 RepID=A0A0D2VMT9_CAPO3|nr:hypothetical protein CAOG_02640 [Capsaspora owczarzaki ATCC 30864]KJE91512.1 hypothetical protein CAOG_002640 [Capsaspora owczarzaki ATCC 30864]|eukprot:XP_004349390.1 hypothetical protein CAOG_02640 [Capsaspora owczarzaki ATCC 30864]